MTDQIYYKVQYPLKKVINKIKKIDMEDPFAGKNFESFTADEVREIKTTLDYWEGEGKEKLQRVIKRLRKIQ